MATGNTTLPPPPPAASNGKAGNGQAKPLKLGKVSAAKAPPRIVINAVEGFGKTSTIAYADNAAILMAAGETGYQTLLGANRVPEIPGAVVESWGELLATLDDLADSKEAPSLLGFDALGGFERLCHDHVCKRDFRGDWGERGFGSFQKGYDLSVTDWIGMLSRLDHIRAAHGTTIVFLSHSKIRSFKNPMGADFDRYVSDVHDKTWGATQKWADAVLFGTFHTIIDQEKQGKGKGIGGTDRVMYCERRDAFDAKNRYGMPAELFLPDDPSQNWTTIQTAMQGGS